ncbi:hypothetical protein BaRGS_00036700 [Batillaria attramentaria]|uniref:Uncharacterized protein n=1 Tax=Batillaria attramentaria TaxID=370345 RepID=A0ABD0JB83_9CAEN
MATLLSFGFSSTFNKNSIQPADSSVPESSDGNSKNCFQEKWRQEFPWLLVTEDKALLCKICVKSPSKREREVTYCERFNIPRETAVLPNYTTHQTFEACLILSKKSWFHTFQPLPKTEQAVVCSRGQNGVCPGVDRLFPRQVSVPESCSALGKAVVI